MTDTFTVSVRVEIVTGSDEHDAELNALALSSCYSNSLAFDYCYDIACYCEVDNCKRAPLRNHLTKALR